MRKGVHVHYTMLAQEMVNILEMSQIYESMTCFSSGIAMNINLRNVKVK
jgi:hypothetical protein